MIFNSVNYLIFFPVVVLLYFIMPVKVRNIWLLICSYFFYMNWNAKYALLLLGSTLITYLCCLILERLQKKEKTGLAKLTLALSFVANLSILFLFKYLDFCIENLNQIFHLFGRGALAAPFDLVLPVGISFYIFQALGVTMDVYRGQMKAEKNFITYALFVSFFPQLVAGPIERSKNLMAQFRDEKKFEVDRVREGLLMMAYGLFMKIVLADQISGIVTNVYENYLVHSGVEILFATVLFAFQIYCDFGGYSYIAIGSAKVLGFTLMDNFRAPYLSLSIHEFWKNWHISLTSWFTDYLYIPLGGNRKGKVRKYLNVLIVFLVSGLWHGSAWTYVIWGGLNGVYMVLEEAFKPIRDKLCQSLSIDRSNVFYKASAWIGTFMLVDFSWLFFRASDLSQAVGLLRQTKANPGISQLVKLLSGLSVSTETAVVLLVGILILFAADLQIKRQKNVFQMVLKSHFAFRYATYALLLFAILFFGIYGYEYAQTAFIYFQF